MSDRTMRDLNLVFRFILELTVLVALFLLGISTSGELVVQVVLGLGLPLLVIVVWGLFVAPKSVRRLPDPARLGLELVIFGSGVVAFILAGHVVPGMLLGAAAVISLILMFLWGQRGL